MSIGGDAVDENLNIHRFANRIPLLFEAGADVVTRVAKTKVKWAAYKIDVKKERVGIFVSLVSTRVPFKGTSKESIAGWDTGDGVAPVDREAPRNVISLESVCDLPTLAERCR